MKPTIHTKRTRVAVLASTLATAQATLDALRVREDIEVTVYDTLDKVKADGWTEDLIVLAGPQYGEPPPPKKKRPKLKGRNRNNPFHKERY